MRTGHAPELLLAGERANQADKGLPRGTTYHLASSFIGVAALLSRVIEKHSSVEGEITGFLLVYPLCYIHVIEVWAAG